MTDTSPEIDKYLHKKMRQFSGTKRLLMGCSMFDTAKTIIISSIKAKEPDISEVEMKIKIFLRLYKNDFDDETKNQIIKHLKQVA